MRVIQAVTERDPTESVGALIDQVRQKVFPMLDDAGRSVKTLADVMQHFQQGEGDVGRLFRDETMVSGPIPGATIGIKADRLLGG